MSERTPLRARQARQDQAERHRPDRQVDIENPAPRQRVGDHSAEHRPRDAAQREDAGDQALVAAALARRDKIGNRRLRQHHQPAGAKPLQPAEQNQPGHRAGEPAQRRAGNEHRDRDDEQWAAPVHVAELAVERCGRGRRQHKRRDDPGQMGEPAKLGDDARQRGADDVLVKRGQRHRGQEPGKAEAKGARRCVVAGGAAHYGPIGHPRSFVGHGIALCHRRQRCEAVPHTNLCVDLEMIATGLGIGATRTEAGEKRYPRRRAATATGSAPPLWGSSRPSRTPAEREMNFAAAATPSARRCSSSANAPGQPPV